VRAKFVDGIGACKASQVQLEKAAEQMRQSVIRARIIRKLHDSLPLSTGKELQLRQEKHRQSGNYISRDDVLNLRINLETTKSVSEFISTLN
jgi:hypothetical protein